MEVALYHPEHGYYRHPRDPFGREGDFYTAEQVQPVFGILIAARIRQLFETMGRPAGFTVVELGAGRAEMAKAFSEWRYVPVDIGFGELPERITGVVFSNEFFDALPVDVAVYRDGVFREQLVALDDARFVWRTGGKAPEAVRAFLRAHLPEPEEGNWYEASLEAPRWMERIARSLEAGYVLSVDYGYTSRESIRFPSGTLMGYRRHTAREDVLEAPGERDITAHVNFTALEAAGAAAGLITDRFETLARMLIDAGEPDQFAEALAGANEEESLHRRLQLKTLLFGMGETFRTLLQRRA
jgi:SAM-dependent MidA family methyltransferase